MTQAVAPPPTAGAGAPPDGASDLRIDHRVRAFLAEVNKDSSPFWELPVTR